MELKGLDFALLSRIFIKGLNATVGKYSPSTLSAGFPDLTQARENFLVKSKAHIDVHNKSNEENIFVRPVQSGASIYIYELLNTLMLML